MATFWEPIKTWLDLEYPGTPILIIKKLRERKFLRKICILKIAIANACCDYFAPHTPPHTSYYLYLWWNDLILIYEPCCTTFTTSIIYLFLTLQKVEIGQFLFFRLERIDGSFFWMIRKFVRKFKNWILCELDKLILGDFKQKFRTNAQWAPETLKPQIQIQLWKGHLRIFRIM